jgi:hypothetical protein
MTTIFVIRWLAIFLSHLGFTERGFTAAAFVYLTDEDRMELGNLDLQWYINKYLMKDPAKRGLTGP